MGDQVSSEDRDLDEWLAELAGKETANATEASRLRQLILDEHGRHESEFDDVRARRLRQRLLSELGETSAPKRQSQSNWTRPVALAASVIVVVGAGLMTSRMLDQQVGIDDSGWVYSYGELQRTRGEAKLLRADVDQHEEVARRVGVMLARESVIFAMTPRDDGTYRFEIYAPDAEALDGFNIALEMLGLRAESPGFYILIVS